MTTALDATPDNLAGCKQGFGDIKGDMPLGDKALKPCGPSATPTATTTASEAPSADVDSEVDGHRFTFDETVIIFDWDDTVLPSSWVQEQGLRLDGESQLTPTQQVLVTNAERGWIELSSRKFLPSLLPTLEDVKLLSARTEYERPEVVSPFEWKLRAFQHEILRLFHERGGGQQKRKNILSFGDSAHEREALIHATANLPNCRTKSLKFVERPRIETLRKQHSLVARCVKKIVHHDGNLDLCLRSLG
eukprot:TRINITY_DN2887_c0_g1_i1.p1 TRINITY_DN2887_c0_g1~~TRINITY_DN2887_c0_g1_i1.p1  ORF type:complete len:248 (+),score=59.54 TRINITY_DN2887_c0_g1_i1:304-1047(+)